MYLFYYVVRVHIVIQPILMTYECDRYAMYELCSQPIVVGNLPNNNKILQVIKTIVNARNLW